MFNITSIITYMMSTNLMLVLLYRLTLLNTSVSTALYFMGYGICQIPTGILLDTCNVFGFVAISSTISFFVIFKLLFLQNFLNITLLNNILLFMYGTASTLGMLGCMRVFRNPDKYIFIATAIVCVISFVLSYIDISVANQIMHVLYFAHAIIGIVSAYMYFTGATVAKINTQPIQRAETGVIADIKLCIKQNGVFSFIVNNVIPVVMIMIISHISCAYCFLFVTSVIRTEILQSIGYDMTYIMLTSTLIGFAFSFLLSHLIPDVYTSLVIIMDYILCISLVCAYKILIRPGIFNPIVIGILIAISVSFDNLKSVLLFRKIKAHSSKYSTTLISLANLSAVTVSITYAILSKIFFVDSAHAIFLFTIYTSLLGLALFAIYIIFYGKSNAALRESKDSEE